MRSVNPRRSPTRSGANVPGGGRRRDRGTTRPVARPVLALLAGLVLLPLLHLPADAQSGDLAGDLVGDLAQRYRELGVYRDEGTVEITRFEDGTQTTERLLFTTRRTPAGFEMELWPDTGSQTVLWTRAGRLYRYDAGVRQFAPAASFTEGLPTSVDPVARDSLLVPRWLLKDTAELSLPSLTPTIETGQPCDETAGDRPKPDGDGNAGCRLLTFTDAASEGSPQARWRLWIDETDGLVRRVEVERGALASESEPPAKGGIARAGVWIHAEVVHRVTTAGAGDTDAEGEDELAAEGPFVPPPEARAVEEITELPADGPRIFSEGIQVFELLIPVRVLDRDGEVVTGLGPEDFVLRVGDSEIPVESATWVDPVDPALRQVMELTDEERRDLGLEDFVPGRLVVIFFQADFNAPRIKGHMSFLRDFPELLEVFTPEDRLAVVAFDSHLKLWQDFTTDREAVLDAMRDAYRFGARPGDPRPGNVPESLAEHFDSEAAKDAAFVEQGLELVAHALEAFNGRRVLLFLGWGVGHNNPQAYREAHRALLGAGVTVHALDITYADVHDLAYPLAGMARATGGTYSSTHNHPGWAIRTVRVALGGHYELSLDATRLPADGGRVHVDLREGLEGRIETPDYEVRPPVPEN